MTTIYSEELNAAKEAVAKAASLCSEAQADLKSIGALDKADKSPVTIADFGAQALVLNSLAKAFPNDPATGEEDASELLIPENTKLLEEIVRRVRQVEPSLNQLSIISAIERGSHPGGGSGRFWTLDPIDGTKGFLRGDQYAIALGLIENGEVVAGVLGCPNLPVDPSGPGTPLARFWLARMLVSRATSAFAHRIIKRSRVAASWRSSSISAHSRTDSAIGPEPRGAWPPPIATRSFISVVRATLHPSPVSPNRSESGIRASVK